ncbi:unnamed protein product [Heligmosomoides polygyrus]|uniref:Peptidase A1 domain-containing protein n=1 Tax=Heligmosomoides polygyrus TaxID=6339 RepID=A0A183GLB8_HELPZ|nr:unnamed protein product [Heligmosomoides polygyrus]
MSLDMLTSRLRYTKLEHSETFVPLNENGASETRPFLMNIPTYAIEVGQHSLRLADARCYEHDVVSEAKMVVLGIDKKKSDHSMFLGYALLGPGLAVYNPKVLVHFILCRT